MEAPRIPSIVRLNKNKRFSFKPRYYDRRKEMIKERTKHIEESLQNERMGEGLSFDRYRRFSRRHATRNSNTRILIIACILALIAYYLLSR